MDPLIKPEDKVAQSDILKIYEMSLDGLYDDKLLDNVLTSCLFIVEKLIKFQPSAAFTATHGLLKIAKSSQEKITAIDSVIHLAHSSGFYAQHLIKHKDKNEIFIFLENIAGYRKGRLNYIFDKINRMRDPNVVSSHSIYGTIELPGFKDLNKNAVRDTEARFNAMGLNEATIRGKTILDIGCNMGQAMVSSFALGARMCIGLESNPKLADIAHSIFTEFKMNYCRVLTANANSLSGDYLMEITNYAPAFDLVFSFAVDGYVAEPYEYYAQLAVVTKQTLFLESNYHLLKEPLSDILRKVGFREVQIVKVPYCTAEGNVRDCYICTK